MDISLRASSRSSTSAWRGRLLLSLGVVFAAALGAQGCGTEETGTPQSEPCVSRAVQVADADGRCTWADSCEAGTATRCGVEVEYECTELPPEACALDSRCRLTEATACPGCAPGTDPSLCQCTTSSFCEPAPSSACAGLDEASCVASSSCYAEYGWLASGQRPEAAPCGGANCGADFAPPEPTWGFVGCTDNATGPCAGLDVYACESHPGCEPIYGSACTPCDPDSGAACECLAIAVYEGCRQLATDCDAHRDLMTCEATDGCHWELSHGRSDRAAPCLCPDDGTSCDTCAGFVLPEEGHCVPDFPTDRCAQLVDEASCTDVGCEWVFYLQRPGQDEPGADCLCDAAEPNCRCAGLIAPADGYCTSPGTEPSGCERHTDEFSCASTEGCAWDAPTATCTTTSSPPACAGLDYDTCQSSRTCQWNDGSSGEPLPCDCDSSEPDCVCSGLIAPACDPDAALGADGVCYDAAGNEVDSYCCEQGKVVPGFCELRER